jgi:cysteine desulfurase
LAGRLYLDHAATTPVLPVARAAVADAFGIWANPSSPHAAGRAAKAALEEARLRIAAALGWTGEVLFTSGATEAIAIVLSRVENDALIVGAGEHDAVHRHAERAVALPVGTDGQVGVHAMAGRLGALGAKAPLVVVQTANSETGVLQPLDDMIAEGRRAGALFFADAAQTAGKRPLPDADFIALSAHKFGGPPGIGALLVRDLATLRATGGQERGYRGGTENLPAVLGMAAALDAPKAWVERAADLRKHLDGAIEAAGGEVVAKASPRIPTIASYRMPGVAAAAQLIQFDLAGIAVSAGSACASGSLKPSAMLTAIMGEEAAREVVRVSFGPDTSRADVYRFVEVWQRIHRDARTRAA